MVGCKTWALLSDKLVRSFPGPITFDSAFDTVQTSFPPAYVAGCPFGPGSAAAFEILFLLRFITAAHLCPYCSIYKATNQRRSDVGRRRVNSDEVLCSRQNERPVSRYIQVHSPTYTAQKNKGITTSQMESVYLSTIPRCHALICTWSGSSWRR